MPSDDAQLPTPPFPLLAAAVAAAASAAAGPGPACGPAPDPAAPASGSPAPLAWPLDDVAGDSLRDAMLSLAAASTATTAGSRSPLLPLPSFSDFALPAGPVFNPHAPHSAAFRLPGPSVAAAAAAPPARPPPPAAMQDCAATRSPHQGSSGSWGRAEHDIAAASYASRGLGGLCTDACDPDADADADADACCAGDSACSPIRSRSRHGRRSRSRSAGDGHVRSPDRDVYAASNPDGSCSPSSSVDNPDVLFFKHTLSPLQSSSRRSILSQQLHDLDLGSPALRCCPPDCRPGPADPHAPDAACCSPLAHDRDLGRDSARTSGSGSGGELHDASGSPARCCGRCGPGCCAGDDADADIDADVRSVSGAASATSSASATRDTSSVESASHMGSANTPFDPTLSPFMHPEDRCHHRTGHHHCTHDSHAPHHPQSLAGTLHHHTDRHQHLAFQPVPLLSQHPGTPIRRRLTLADMKAAHNQPAAAQHHPQPVQGRGAVHRLDQGPEHDHAHGDHHRDDQGLDPNDHLRHRPHAAARDGDRDSALGSSPIASPRPLRPAGAFMEPLDPLLRLRLPRLRCNSWEGAPRFPSLSPNLERAGSASHHQHHQHHHIHHHHNHHRHCHCQHCHDWRRQRHLKECEEATLRVLDSASAEAW